MTSHVHALICDEDGRIALRPEWRAADPDVWMELDADPDYVEELDEEEDYRAFGPMRAQNHERATAMVWGCAGAMDDCASWPLTEWLEQAADKLPFIPGGASDNPTVFGERLAEHARYLDGCGNESAADAADPLGPLAAEAYYAGAAWYEWAANQYLAIATIVEEREAVASGRPKIDRTRVDALAAMRAASAKYGVGEG